jgi:hypothetical protein
MLVDIVDKCGLIHGVIRRKERHKSRIIHLILVQEWDWLDVRFDGP